MIIMEDVTKTYSTGVAALNGINLHIQKGEFVFIVGKSGSGKSTLIKLLLKELDPTSGKIYVNKKYLNKITRKKLPYLRRDIGVVFQDFRLLPDRNVYENVAFAQRVIGRPTRVIRKRVPEVLQEVGLAGKYKAFPDELSGGEQQRVAIARALAKNPKLLLCDEPTGALDYNTGKSVLKLLQDTCRNTGTTVIVITHNQALTAMADRVITVKSGTVEKVVLNDNIKNVEDLEW